VKLSRAQALTLALIALFGFVMKGGIVYRRNDAPTVFTPN